MKPERISHAETRKAKREQLLAAARKVFATTGYEAATIRDIVRESGLAQGSFYNNFKTKQDIFQAITEEITAPLIPRLKQTRAAAGTGREFLFNAYDACRILPLENPEAAAIIMRNQVQFRELFYLGGTQAQIKWDLVADLQSAHARGLFKAADFELMAEAMIALGFDLIVHVSHSPGSAAERVDFLTTLFEDALA